MPTVTSWKVVETLIENDGCYPGDPQAFAICSYLNVLCGKRMYHISYNVHEFSAMVFDPNVADVEVLWSKSKVGGI